MNCPKCDSTEYRKDGIVIGRQRYRCKECDYRYTVRKRSPRVPEKKKRFAIELYLEGMGFRAIGRVLKVSQVSVMNWVRQYARQLEPIKSPSRPVVVEMDEMHSYIRSKKNTAGFGLLSIDWKSGYSTLSLAAEEPERAQNCGGR